MAIALDTGATTNMIRASTARVYECKARVSSVRRTQASFLRNSDKTVILPGDYLELHTPCDVNTGSLWALEPRLDSLKPERASSLRDPLYQ
ncbi:hypothetical protein NP493_7g09030 [Ridgeia piscesae]|uniref:Uncharacterized protein n=1 Tax=Ridgeia piscesae TaxID=27915 RepID=A0AAD9PFA9_RIDPI|nr:hypothetical protein NP493_7g09030 [Ridgeia piscesae]